MNEIYKAIRDKLILDTGLAVHDHVPQDLSEYPFIRLDAIQLDESDTDGETGFTGEFQVITFSRYHGLKEVNNIADSVYSSLHRWAMPNTATYGVTNIIQTTRGTVTQEDGLTRHSVQRFTVVFEKLV